MAAAGISIFAKKHFYTRSGRLMRMTSMIRGEQIAQAIGAKLNPESGYENDVCIYVKPYVNDDRVFDFAGRSYLDLIDTFKLTRLAKNFPDVSIIACSENDKKVISEAVENKVVCIPQHHCNFERIQKESSELKTVGVVANPSAMKYLPEGLKDRLAEIGLDFVPFENFRERQDLVNYYQTIDLQIVWRPWFTELSNPLKMVNAASFGVPSIALDEPSFSEMEGCYIPVKTLDEFILAAEKLKSSPTDNEKLVQRGVEKAEEYHIENIAKMYKALT